jgi:membrane AbrB-like protein
MIAVAVASGSGKFAVVLPCWLVAGAYAGVGWYVGLAFTREVVRYALRSLPILAGSTLLLIVLCAAVGESLRGLIHADPLTAYLATSPGGLDSVAIIALGSGANVPLVLAIQLEGKSPASPSSSMPGCGTLRSPPNARSNFRFIRSWARSSASTLASTAGRLSRMVRSSTAKTPSKNTRNAWRLCSSNSRAA